MLPSLSFTELTPELTADVKKATQILLPVSDDIEGVTMEFVDDLDPETIPLSQLEKLLIEMEGMKTTHLGYIYIFPTAQCTNKPVQTDITQTSDVTLKTEFVEQDICTQDQFHVTDTNQLIETSNKYKQSISTSSVTTNKDPLNNNNYVSGEGSYPTLVSAEVQTDPVLQLSSLRENLLQPPSGEIEKLVGSPDTDTIDIVGEDDTRVPINNLGDKPTTKHTDVKRDESTQQSLYTTDSHDKHAESDTDSFESMIDMQKEEENVIESIDDFPEDDQHAKDDTDDHDNVPIKNEPVLRKTTRDYPKSSHDDTDAGQIPSKVEKDKTSDKSKVPELEKEVATLQGSDADTSGVKTSTSQKDGQKDVLSQTLSIIMDDKSNQTSESMNKGNQTDAIKTLEKSSAMELDKFADTQTDEIITMKQETQGPVVTHMLSQTKAISNEEHPSQTERTVVVDEELQTEDVIKNRDSQTDTTETVHSQTEMVTKGDVDSQTDVTPNKDEDCQTVAVPLKDRQSQTEQLIDETVPLASSPGSKAPPTRKRAVESESQTDLTESMLLAILGGSSSYVTESGSEPSVIGAFGYEKTKRTIQRREGEGEGFKGIIASSRSESGYADASRSRSEEASEIQTKHHQRVKKFGIAGAISPGRNDDENLLDISADGSEGNMEFPDFLDGPGDSAIGAEGNEDNGVDEGFAADNGESYLPDLVSPDDRLLSGVAGDDDDEGKDIESGEIVGGLISQHRGTGSKSGFGRKISPKGMMGFQERLKSTKTGSGYKAEASARGRGISGGSSSVKPLILGRSGEQTEQSAEPATGKQLSSLTETEAALRATLKQRPPIIIKYAEEDKVGDLCTNFCRCCLPPYVLFLLLLALACLLSLFEPDSRCCFENHYPSTFGVMMTYPNGPPPI